MGFCTHHLLMPHGGGLNMGGWTDGFMPAMQHHSNKGGTQKIQIDLKFFVSGQAHIIGGHVDFEIF